MIDLPELIILDVGRGNCAILRDTKSVTVIDCPPPTILLETLESLGINSIDHVLISHADLDHAGGLPNLLDEIAIRNVYINPDAEKTSKSWIDIRIALELAEEKGTEIHTSLTASLSRKIKSGQVEIEILAPSLGVALGGVGGTDLEGRKLTANSMSVVIGLIHNSCRVALLPGDMSEIGLDNLLKKHENIEAQILLFPHHGGTPGNTRSKEFAYKLCHLVHPELVVFSFGRGWSHVENPRSDIIQGVLSAVPDAHIMCTQLSRNCAVELPISDFSHLTSLPAMGRLNNCCCGGTVIIKIDGEQTTYIPLLLSHRDFVSDKQKVPAPMCLLHAIKA